MEGTWGLVIMFKNLPDQLFVARNGSPILVGFSEQGIFVSSEPIGFSKYTNKFIRLEDREILKFEHSSSLLESIKKRLVFYEKIEIKLKPTEGYRCFFEEEIYE